MVGRRAVETAPSGRVFVSRRAREMRFHPDSSPFRSPLDVGFVSVQVAVVVLSDGERLRGATCVGPRASKHCSVPEV